MPAVSCRYPHTLWLQVAVHLMGKGGAALVLIMLFMAVTSTGSAEQIAVSSLFSYGMFLHPHPQANCRASSAHQPAGGRRRCDAVWYDCLQSSVARHAYGPVTPELSCPFRIRLTAQYI